MFETNRPRSANLLLLLLTGCGGAEPPAGPGGTGPAATVALQGGDGQTAEPGAALSVRPAVLVRDAAGHPVAGVTVAFRVETGAGTITAGTPTSSADGVATAGSWTLGPAEGPQTVSASVAALPPVTFTATAVFSAVQVLDQVIPTGGSTVSVTRAGDPLDGLRLVVPPNAYRQATRWRIGHRSAAALPARPGVNPISPLITVATGFGGYADSGLLLTIPARTTPGRFAGAFYYDRSAGMFEALPVAERTATAITIFTRHFSAASLLRPAGLSTAAAATSGVDGIPAVGEVEIFISEIDTTDLDRNIDSRFRSAVDGWEVDNRSGWAISRGGHCSGWSASALWYYYTQRTAHGSLFDRYSAEPGTSEDNVRGWRWADLTWKDTDWESLLTYVLGPLAKQYNNLAAGRYLTERRALAYAIKVTGMPQYLGFMVSQNGGSHAVIGYRTEPDRVYYADPAQPGVEVSGPFGPALQAGGGDGHLYHMMIGLSSVNSFESLSARWASFENGTIGDREYPAMTLERALVTGQDTSWVAVGDTLKSFQTNVRLRARCPSCPGFGGGKGDLSRIRFVNLESIDTVTSVVVDAGFNDPPTADAPPYHTEHQIRILGSAGRFGAVLEGFRTPENLGRLGRVTYRPILVRSEPLTIEAGTTTPDIGEVVRFTARPHGLLTGPARFRWDFGDGSPVEVVNQDSTTTHAFQTANRFTVRLTVIDQATGRTLTTASLVVSSLAEWRITEMVGPRTSPIPPFGGGGPMSGFLSSFVAGVEQMPGSQPTLLYGLSGPLPAVFFQATTTSNGQRTPFALLLARAELSQRTCEWPDGLAVTGSNTSGTLAGRWVEVCIGEYQTDQGGLPITYHAVSWFELSATKIGAEIRGTITFTVRDYVLASDHHIADYRPLGDYVMHYEFAGTRAP